MLASSRALISRLRFISVSTNQLRSFSSTASITEYEEINESQPRKRKEVSVSANQLRSVSSTVKKPEKEGISALQIGCGHKKEKQLTKPEVGHFRAQGVPMMRKLKEFPVTVDALLPTGFSLGVRHFVPGQYVDIAGLTRGKGFQVNS